MLIIVMTNYNVIIDCRRIIMTIDLKTLHWTYFVLVPG